MRGCFTSVIHQFVRIIIKTVHISICEICDTVIGGKLVKISPSVFLIIKDIYSMMWWIIKYKVSNLPLFMACFGGGGAPLNLAVAL